MAKSIDFNSVSGHYETNSLVQKGAAETLFALLSIGENESVLDVGCGPGNLTKRIRDITSGRVVGIDASKEMIKSAKRNYEKFYIEFYEMRAEEMNFHEEFDVIFCNSTFQWFTHPEKVVSAFYSALKKNGRVGIQAPGGGRYCENFLKAIDRIKSDPGTKDIFSRWKNPFFMPEKASDYSIVFEKAGFKVTFAEIKTINTKYTPEEAFNIFSSGAIAGYLNREYYEGEISEEYIESFKGIVKEEIKKEAEENGHVELIFRRIFLTGVKV